MKAVQEEEVLVPETFWMGQAPRLMVQVICLTIDGRKVVCLGPVLHVPPLGLHVGDIQEIEFGEMIPASLAAKLLDGSMSEGMGLQ